MAFQGLITGTLGYELKREFLSNSIAFREVETFNYEIYSVDFVGLNAVQIQNQIKNQFNSLYSGDVRVKVFDTQHSYQYPSDSLRAAKFGVTVELKKPIANLSTMFPELSSGQYAGLDSSFWTSYGQYLLEFKEEYGFSTNANGNREFNHSLSFGLQTGWVGSDTQSGRKSYAQTIASGIFSQDQNTTFGISTLAGIVSGIANTGLFRNFYTESYDLFKNSYSFGRKRELLPFDAANAVLDLSNSINMNSDGTIDVSEKASTVGKIDFSLVKANLDTYLGTSYSRCSGFYYQFYNTGIMLQDSQYQGLGFNTSSNLLPLINTPVKTVKSYDARSLTAGYDVSYTNNPTFSGDGTITSQHLEFNIDTYDRVEASHSFDYTVNKIINDSGYFTNVMSATTGISPVAVSNYYNSNFPQIAAEYPAINMVKKDASWSNIKTKGSAKISYSNNPSYFITLNGITFGILDYSVETRIPSDTVNEYKIINRPTNKSVLSYAYQTEKGEVTISVKATLGKQSHHFNPSLIGSFYLINGIPLTDYVAEIYKYCGQIFLGNFITPMTAFNWFISDSKYLLDSDGNLNLTLTYVYTLKKRNPSNFL